MHICSLTLLLKQSDCSIDAVRGILTRRDPSFWPRLPGLTKLMGRFTKDGDWRKALAIFDSLPVLGLRPDTTISNAAIAACDKGRFALSTAMVYPSPPRCTPPMLAVPFCLRLCVFAPCLVVSSFVGGTLVAIACRVHTGDAVCPPRTPSVLTLS